MKNFAVFMLVLLIGVALFWFELAQYEPMFYILGIALLIVCIFSLIMIRQKKRNN